jgi:putative hydrolase of the HAD superfamily
MDEQIDLNRYEHLMLDMNGTFIFEFDRFDKDQDFAATYTASGYKSLAAEKVQSVLHQAYAYLAVRYLDEDWYHRFPSVEAAIRQVAGHLSDRDVAELTDTFASHELGVLPEGHKESLHTLARQCSLSILSNLWSPKHRWLERFDQWGITSHFSAMHFSSDGLEMKPHPAFFQRALGDLRLSPKQVLFIGDSFRCDVMGASEAGIDVVWLSGNKPLPDRPRGLVGVCRDLPEFVSRTMLEKNRTMQGRD